MNFVNDLSNNFIKMQQYNNKEKRADELAIANKELAFQNKEKEKRADELAIANKELAFQNKEKEKRADELIIANKELAFQNEEKEKRAEELIIANKELAFQNKEKEKRADELIIANKELAFQNEEKEKRAEELIIANKELKNAEIKIRELNASLEEKVEKLVTANKELEQFAYVATHDLQEPLRMISSYTQLLERRYKDKLDADANEFIHYVVDGAIRMQKLINDLHDYTMISIHGKNFEQVDSSYILGQVISNLQLLIAENTALITNDELPIVRVDESQILRVFQNLIENAIKFKKKSELPRIHISCKKKNDLYEFSVRDNGIGIEIQYHERVFTIFQRLHSLKDYSGTGIGLSICKRIVERHGGTIWFESKVNVGTTFYFTISI